MITRVRLLSGVVLAAFVLVHFANHALALISLEAAEAYRAAVHWSYGSRLGTVVLYAAFSAHFLMALVSLYQRRTLRLAPWELAQLIAGVLFVPLLATHVIAMRGGESVLDIIPEYARTVGFIWSDPVETGKQFALIFIAWVHAVLGMHFWLRLRSWYRRSSHLWAAFYAVAPLLTWLGFYRAGRDSEARDPAEVIAAIERMGVPAADYVAFVDRGTTIFLALTGGLIVLTLLARTARVVWQRRLRSFTVEHTGGHVLGARHGQTLLEVLRANRIAHASVCGGRGRCTTCRVRIGTGAERLPPANEREQAALRRIGAPTSVRLACQTRPSANLVITPLVPPRAALTGLGLGGGVEGTERVVSVLFVDLRGSTKLGQDRLPYDVLFILNLFFSQMSAALSASSGHYAQFNGDGLMAIYGRDGNVAAGARASLHGALEMFRRLDQLNARLGEELREPLRIGIGIHTGEAIVGTMGPPSAPIVSAIGDNINVAARLEAMTKALGAPLVASHATIEQAGLDPRSFGPQAMHAESVPIRGRSGELDVWAISEPEALARDLGVR